MSENPYTPPGAPVNDPREDVPPVPRPREVVIAVRLLWVSLIAGIPVSIRDFQDGPPADDGGFLLMFTFALYAISVLMIVFIGRGRNWARIALLVFNILNLLSFLLAFAELRKYPTGEFAILLIVLGLDLAALYLLYTRAGSPWFRQARAAS